MMTIKKMNVIANYRKINRAKGVIIGMSYLFLWGCAKVNLNNQSPGYKKEDDYRYNETTYQQSIVIAKQFSKIMDCMDTKLRLDNNPPNFPIAPLFLKEIVWGGKYVFSGITAVGSAALLLLQRSGEAASSQSCIQTCSPIDENYDDNKIVDLRVTSIRESLQCASGCGSTISVLLPGITLASAIAATVCIFVENTWYSSMTELNNLDFKRKYENLRREIQNIIQERSETDCKRLKKIDMENSIKAMCKILCDLFQHINSIPKPKLNNNVRFPNSTCTNLINNLNAFHTHVYNDNSWEPLLKTLSGYLTKVEKKPNEVTEPLFPEEAPAIAPLTTSTPGENLRITIGH